VGHDSCTLGSKPVSLNLSDDERHARLHIEVNPTDRDQDAELERLLATGARIVDIGQPAEASWHVLADPEGNEFCLVTIEI
jgi:Glyoxalase-like domain